eukprot:XP_014049041.1 PREDICTED: nucleosome-remodeling factor subunit BPTF-like [Salmo salar]
MRGKRGRPPKTLRMQEPSSEPERGLRPRRELRAKGRGSAEVDFESPKRGNNSSSRGRRKVGSSRGRGRGRGCGGRGTRGRRSIARSVVYDDHESDEDDDAVSLRSEEDELIEEETITDEEEEALNVESDPLEEILEEDDDDASYCTESSFLSQSTHGSTPGKPAILIKLLREYEILERVQGRQERRAVEQAEKAPTDTTKIEEETPTHCSPLPDHRELQDPESKEEASSQAAAAPPAGEENTTVHPPKSASSTQDGTLPKPEPPKPAEVSCPAASESRESGEASMEPEQERPDDKPVDSESHGEEDPSAQCQPTPPPPHPGDENSNSSHVSAPGVLRRPEEPNLADRSSQSSITSQDDTGEGKESVNGEGSASGRTNNRIVTRLRNPDSKLSQQKTQGDGSPTPRDSKETSPPSSESEVARLGTVRKELTVKGNLNNFFKLGQEGKFRVYHNQFSTNTLGLNKHQHREDHDKRRHLSHKFSLTPAGDFKWNGSIHGSKVLTISTLRLTIIQLETNVPAPFLHPNWASHRTNWIKAVQMCSKAREFALALAIMECAIKPVVMLPVWKDALGHTSAEVCSGVGSVCRVADAFPMSSIA